MASNNVTVTECTPLTPTEKYQLRTQPNVDLILAWALVKGIIRHPEVLEQIKFKTLELEQSFNKTQGTESTADASFTTRVSAEKKSTESTADTSFATNVSAEKKYSCEKCGKQFDQRDRFLRHINSCEGALLIPQKKEHTCDKCGKSFQSKKKLTRHKLTCKGNTPQSFECGICKKTFKCEKNFVKHNSKCEPNEPVSFHCRLCSKMYKSMSGLKKHESCCERDCSVVFLCSFCAKTFSRKNHVVQHEKICRNLRSPKKNIKCRSCGEIFVNRRDLYRHKLNQHGGAAASHVQNFQLVAPPWKDDEGNVIDPALERVYNDNAVHILAPHTSGEVLQTYNFPTENLSGGVEEFMNHIEQIYREQDHSFRLNINLGFILRNRETGEYRYFIPYTNSYLFRAPYTVSRHTSLRALKNKLKRINPEAYVQNHRPNSQWKVVYITNIHFDISLLDYVLGHTSAKDLPQHVKTSNSVLTFVKHPHKNQSYNDNLCFFRCLAWHDLKTMDKLATLTEQKYQKWMDYKSMTTHARNFQGVRLDDFPDLENCFQININAFQLLANQCVSVHFKSTSQFDETVYLDIQNYHVSYIQDMDNYAKRYQCSRCNRIFKRYFHLKRHYAVCSKVTKLKFPGGFHKVHQNVFEEMEKYNIHVPLQDRVFPHFITFDFESVLLKVKGDLGKKLVWEEKHVPISVGVGSNVPGFEKGVCFVNYDLDELLCQMLEHMNAIAERVKKIQKQKFAKIFLELESKLNEFKDDDTSTGSRAKDNPASSKVGANAVDCDAREVDDYEPPCKKFVERVGILSVFEKMLTCLKDTGQMSVDYNDYSSDESDMELEGEDEDIGLGDGGDPQEPTDESDPRSKFRKTMYKKIQNLYGRLETYCQCIPVLGFNSAKYDLNLVKSKLCKHLRLADPDTECFTVKRNNSYLCICTETLKFLDISHYIAPGYSYAQFLKSYKATEKKSFFCYQYLSDPSVLDETRLPDYEAFYSSLKGVNVLEQETISWREKRDVNLKTQDLENHMYDKVSFDYDSPYIDCQLLQKCLLCKNHCRVGLDCSVCSEARPLTGFQNYLELLKLWKDQSMQTVKDFLIHYNLKDIDPFTEAVTNLQKFYFENNVDLFKDTISVPGVARKMLFRSKDANFSLFDYKNEDLYRKVKQNVCGGPSIVFTRSMKVGQRLKNGEEICAKIFGFDANALYPYCMRLDMPCGAYVRRLETDGYKGEIQSKYLDMYVWMDKISQDKNIKILHKLNSGKEHYIMGFYVDGIHNTDIYEYHGCYYHGCKTCTERMKYKKSEKWLKTQQAKYERTKHRKEYLKSRGYEVHEIWECQFKRQFTDSTEAIRDKYVPKYYSKCKGQQSKEALLKAIQSGELFGMAEVDIEVPQTWRGDFTDGLPPYEYFKEFSPIFCTTDVPKHVIGEHMTRYAEEHNVSTDTRRLLVGGMKARQILLSTPLLQWYLNHGLIVTKLYEVTEFSPVPCFKDFVQKCVDARRESDSHPDLALQGATYKVLLNSSYGSSLLNKENFSDTKYLNGHSAAKLEINKPEFRKASLLGDEMYELEHAKRSITLDTPITIGFFVLNYAKLRMLEFYYDCLCKYIPRDKFELCECDTDSLYFGLAHKTLEEAVVPILRENFMKHIAGKCGQPHVADSETFFPRTCCPRDAKFDARTESLFKQEYTGSKMVALCSKTYAIDNQGQCKFSSKGVNKRNVKNPMAIMTEVLESKLNQSSLNRGFRAKDNGMYTYRQQKVGFNYFYCKRQVHEDGIHTSPLDLVLTPWSDFNRYTFEKDSAHPLCNSYPCILKINELQFGSLEHFLVYRLVLFHAGEEDAKAVQKETSLAAISKCKKAISVDRRWHIKFPEVLEVGLKEKYNQCQIFKDTLDHVNYPEIVYADPDKDLGCGMEYRVAVLTKSSKFPGQNILGEALIQLKIGGSQNEQEAPMLVSVSV